MPLTVNEDEPLVPAGKAQAVVEASQVFDAKVAISVPCEAESVRCSGV